MVLRGVVLAACVTGSLALHLGVLLSGATPAPTPASRSVRAHGPSSGVTVVRFSATTAATTVTAPSTAPLPSQPTAWDPEHLPPTGAGLASATPATADTTVDTIPDRAPDADYLPRDQLTRAPAPQQTIDLLYPEWAPSGRFRAVVTLFIDDRGVVQRVRIDEAGDSGLPPVLEDATRQTFLRSTFAPGEIDGHPTRSRLRIEVEYVTETLHGDPQTAAR